MRSRLTLPLLAAVAVALAFLWGVGDSLRPFATTDRDVVQSTPGLGALDSRYTVRLRPGDRACVRPVTLTPRSQQARVRVLAPQTAPAPPIEVTARGPGYRATGTIAGYRTGGDDIPAAALTPPARELDGEVCMRNAGRTPVELVGAQDIRSQVPAELVVDGDVVAGKDLELTILERERRSIVERPGELVDHARALGPDFAPAWLLWVVLVLVAVGLPVAAVAGFFGAVRRHEPLADRHDARP